MSDHGLSYVDEQTVSSPVPEAVPSRQRIEHGGRIFVTRVGLRFSADLTFEDWEQAGPKLFRVADSSAWCLGDWLVCGEHRYKDRYRRAVEAAGIDYKTLRNYAWVARRFDLSRRRDKLSLQHHAEVASLPPDEQDYWLDQAEQAGWSRNQLRNALRGEARQDSQRTSAPAALSLVGTRPDSLQRWQTAASLCGRALENWITETLDRAATEVLQHENFGQWPKGA